MLNICIRRFVILNAICFLVMSFRILLGKGIYLIVEMGTELVVVAVAVQLVVANSRNCP